MTGHSDGPTLDLTNTRPLAESVAANFSSGLPQQVNSAYLALIPHIESNASLRDAVAVAWAFFRDNYGPDAEAFGEVIGAFAQVTAEDNEHASS